MVTQRLVRTCRVNWVFDLLTYLFTSIAVANLKDLKKKMPVFLLACALCSDIPSNIYAMILVI